MAASPHPTIQYTSDKFVESVGVVLINIPTHTICLVPDWKSGEWVLPQGRCIEHGRPQDAVVGVVEAQVGLPMDHLPVTFLKLLEGGDESTTHDTRVYYGREHPFMISHVKPTAETVATISWHLAVVEEVQDKLEGHDCRGEFFAFKEARKTLKYQTERDVLKKAIKIFHDTMNERESAKRMMAEKSEEEREALKQRFLTILAERKGRAMADSMEAEHEVARGMGKDTESGLRVADGNGQVERPATQSLALRQELESAEW